jgi:two-component system nitrogen regulation response regulator NtrX
MMPGRVLIIDDEPNIRRMMEMIHKNAGWETATAPGGTQALALLARESFDVIFLDLSMPDCDGMEVLADIRRMKPDQLVVILTGQGTIDRAVEATRLGAFDFLEKDCGKERILLTSRNALERSTLAGENRKLRSRGGKRREFLGESRAAVEIMAHVRRVAPTNARVLILGESGTGKELVAQAIHDRSACAGGPFIKVNCAAIPEELIESELFGAERGAYTGAVQAREGKWQAADGGTLFLDEVGDMSLKVQTKVLRALQEGEIQKVGSNEIIKVDVRVIAATNKNLADEVGAGRFREDLYYRLNVVPINVPSLRERGDDIALLARVFLAEYCAENDMPPKSFDDDVLQALAAYPWPGNVRELRNQVERMAIMCSGRVVRVDDLSTEVRTGAPSVAASKSTQGTNTANFAGKSLQDARKKMEYDLITQTLEKFNWNVSRAAEELGLERTNLHKKMKALGIERK